MKHPVTAMDRGRRLSQLLRQTLRPGGASLPIDSVGEHSGVLLDGGLSGLIWNRLAPMARATPTGRELRQGAFADAASAMRLDARLVEVVQALREAGVEPLVTKGWAVARYYLNPAARPYSDLDLAVRPDQAETARRALNAMGTRANPVDLHIGLPDLPERNWAEVFARSRIESLDGVAIRVLSPECQFRLLAVHLVRHVCCRPLWLIDIAAILEQVGKVMDWEYCLHGSYTWRRWILAVAGLAERLLGTRLPEALQARPGIRPPDWLVEMTCWRWGGGNELRSRELRHTPAEWWPAFAYRQLNPIRWSYRLGLPPFDFLPSICLAAIVGKGLIPFSRFWRSHVLRPQASRDSFVMHTRRVF